ncbi:hypothetical protein ABZY16_18130 [Streptomyces sp. NPDC006553]|uniref:hypothetical protein n=1 Tax=Streptomyces sp. NPDC006553 TaxID=3157180 RepID=UPI0033A30344
MAAGTSNARTNVASRRTVTHYPHDAVAGLLLGALVSVLIAGLLLGHTEHLARRLRTSLLHLLIAS